MFYIQCDTKVSIWCSGKDVRYMYHQTKQSLGLVWHQGQECNFNCEWSQQEILLMTSTRAGTDVGCRKRRLICLVVWTPTYLPYCDSIPLSDRTTSSITPLSMQFTIHPSFHQLLLFTLSASHHITRLFETAQKSLHILEIGVGGWFQGEASTFAHNPEGGTKIWLNVGGESTRFG